jgi:membrane glycosyltransferase
MSRDTIAYTLRRLVLLAFVGGSTALATSLMVDVTAAKGLSWLGLGVLTLFTLLFAWLALSFWTAVMGFLVRIVGGDPMSLKAAPEGPITTRTAIAMPIYNEDTERVAAGLDATLASLNRTGEAGAFDVFVLSDTTEVAIAAREAAAIEALRARHPSGPAIHYRRRTRNIGRKAGNIEDFVKRWGGAYPQMVILDADSVMSGQTLVALARLMQAHPEAGIIQTLAIPANRETPFARILQFASRLYGPIMASGLAFWSGGEGNYYGHNAIIRTAAFARHCGLPILPGRAPIGGEILSHDFVEAALIGRAGYKVWLVPDLPGSYEEMPANLIDYAKRDRRWCQGNMQHTKLLAFPGLTLISRLHLFMGVTSYVTSPLWLALLMLSTADAMDQAIEGTVYFKPGFNLFPDWPIATDFQVHLLVGITLAALFLPKIMATVLALASPSLRRSFGGTFGILASVLGETLFTSLLAPVMMLFQSQFIGTTLTGRSISWDAQPRDDRGLSWREGLVRHWFQTILGLAWGSATWAVAPEFFWWLAPVFAGLTVSIPLCVLSSRISLGLALKRIGLFLTPDETRPAGELRRLRRVLTTGLKFGPATLAAESLVPAEQGLAMHALPWPTKRPVAAGVEQLV